MLRSETTTPSSTKVKKHELSLVMVGKPCPNHEALPTPMVSFNDTRVRKSLSTAPVYTLSSIARINAKSTLIGKHNRLPSV